MKLEAFIKTYSTADIDNIRFNEESLETSNREFRLAVCEVLIKDFSIASDQLILDLYQALSQDAKATWSVYRWYHLFAQELLNRGKTDYLLAYIKGARQSFDTLLASSAVQLSDADKQEIVDFINLRLATHPDDPNKEDFEFALRRFTPK